MAEGQRTDTTVSGSAGTTSTSAALGLAAQSNDVGIDLGDSRIDVPLIDSLSAGSTQSLTTPEPGDESGGVIELAQGSGEENDASVGNFAETGVSTSQTEIASSEEPTELGAEIQTFEPDTDRQPFAAVGGVTLYGPADQIRAAGFHESANTQALEMRELDSPLETMVMESRGRGTGGHTAADMAVYPDEMIYSPVTGTVVDARAYKLYCKYDDNVVIIEPDAAPDRQVKVLHLTGLLIENGERVIAGKTPIASGPTPLPFSSQIDGYVENSTNTHVHIETVDLDLVDATNSTVCP